MEDSLLNYLENDATINYEFGQDGLISRASTSELERDSTGKQFLQIIESPLSKMSRRPYLLVNLKISNKLKCTKTN